MFNIVTEKYKLITFKLFKSFEGKYKCLIVRVSNEKLMNILSESQENTL